ncbi:MAG: hypothetical protein NC209_05980 [Alistipes sp.]|nr:hypothetical protein [Alistipes senegalensis]MCM1250673.1 hypothetical protein [Alistipes sp.]
MKKLFYMLCAVVLAAGCGDDDVSSYYLDELVVDTANCLAEGSYVQGVATTDLCRVKIPYEHAAGGTARISAPETNGLRIDAQEVALAVGAGEATVVVAGTPLLLETSFLQLNVEYRGKVYLSSVEIAVLEDTDPSGSIDFAIDCTPLTGLTAPRTLAFTVDPTMASVVESGTSPEGLRVRIATDPATGAGSVTLTPAANFFGGEVELTASFGAREPQVRTIRVSAFAAGEGTADAPYEVASAAELEKIGSGFDKAFRLTSDLVLDNGWTPAGTFAQPFTGLLDGDGHKITLALDRPEEDRVALFAYVGAGAEVRNLVLDGSVVGRNYVSALAAASETALSADVSAVMVMGANFVAASVASGAGRDARVIEFGTVPAAVNIPMGEESASGPLGLATKGATVTFDPAATGTSWSYDDASGDFTVVKEAGFVSGDVTFRVSLGEKVTSTTHTIVVSSKNMYESGSGTESDPYVVVDGDQFAATLHTYPEAHVKLTEDIVVKEWETLTTFSGSLEGDGHTVEGLTAGFVATNTGLISNIKFKGVDISVSTGFGVVSRTTEGSGRISGVAVSGKVVSTNTGDILGGIAGELKGSAVIENCYVNLAMTASCGMVGGIVGRMTSSGNGVRVTNCTSEGSIEITASKTRIAGIVGRGEGSGKDEIRGCFSSMALSATNANANSFGGIFGANNNNNMMIEECMFSGRIKAAFDVGGIAGVGPNIKNCLVVGATLENTAASSGTGNVGGIASISKLYADNCIVSDATITGVTNNSTAKPAAGVVCSYQNNGKTRNSVVLGTTTIKGGTSARISGTPLASDPLENNYASSDVVLQDGAGEVKQPADIGAGATDGADIPGTPDRTWFESLGYDFSSVWSWDAAAAAPKLQKVGCDDSVKID